MKKNYPATALRKAKQFFLWLGGVLVQNPETVFLLVFLTIMSGGFGALVYTISQLPAETLEIEREVVVDSVRADMGAWTASPLPS